VGFRPGESPVGPFGFYRGIWHCPEADIDPDIFVYNAKAHPHLSTPGKLLISYNVNTFDFGDAFKDADIYRPRFVTLQFSDTLTSINEKSQIPKSFHIFQNYPNPFNSTTNIKFVLHEQVEIILKVFNLLGQEIRTLVNDTLSCGIHSIHWDGKNDSGEGISSGIYIYRIQVYDKIESKKMLFLR